MDNNIEKTRCYEEGQGNEKVENRNFTNKTQDYTNLLKQTNTS